VATDQATATRNPGARRIDHRTALVTLLASLAAMSWAALWLWSLSPWGRYLEHGGWGDAGAIAALCRVVPQGDIIVPASLHAIAWVLMIAAMMLPTTLPLLLMFRRITQARLDAGRLSALVVLGFFVAWFAFGVVAHFADAMLRSVVAESAWFVVHGWAIGAAMLVGAGLFQFSALKYRCLERCHTPFAFVASRWHGRAPAREAFKLGVDHGVFCVGCCWALMLVMFVVGTGSLGWMLALAAVMAAEKSLPWGRRLRTPLGVGLLAWGGAIIVANV
jgi:predicted metal-binding membrane protein